MTKPQLILITLDNGYDAFINTAHIALIRNREDEKGELAGGLIHLVDGTELYTVDDASEITNKINGGK